MTAWQNDMKRDMMIYRFIELAVTMFETTFEEDKDAKVKYDEWIDMVNGTHKDGIRMAAPQPALLVDVRPTQDSVVQIVALPKENNFAAEFKTPAFSVRVSMVYDFVRFDLKAAGISDFDGDMTLALAWAGEMLEKIDDIRITIN